jgi:hypothetical protein
MSVADGRRTPARPFRSGGKFPMFVRKGKQFARLGRFVAGDAGEK